jgi:hypothetical protein
VVAGDVEDVGVELGLLDDLPQRYIITLDTHQ